MRTVAATSALHDGEIVAYVDQLGYAFCRDCAADLDVLDETPATPSAFEIEDACECCGVVLRSVGCAHWRTEIIDVAQHPTLEHTNEVTHRCVKCGTERVLHSSKPGGRAARSGFGYYVPGGSDPDFLR